MAYGKSKSSNAVIALGEALSTPVRGDGKPAMLYFPAAWTAADVAFMVCDTFGGTYVELYDDAGNLVEVSGPDADQAHPLPEAVLSARYYMLWSESSGVDVNQVAARTVRVVPL